MRNLSLCVLLVCSLINAHAQDFYDKELLNLSSVRKLAEYRTGEIEQLSSYDRTGGNDDGFSGKYSFVRKEAGGLVMADLKGPGVVNRIWTPTPTKDTVKFYFDGEKKPRIAVPFIELFTGKTFPFLAPLSGNQVGGYYCYLPIPYEKSLKIVYVGTELKFHQTQYRTLRKEDAVKSFTNELVRTHQAALEKVSTTWNRKVSPVAEYGNNVKEKKINIALRSGVEESLFSLASGGRLVGIELDAGTLTQVYRKVMLTARWDNESKNALDLPLHDFFGFAFGKSAMQSILLGANLQKLHSYLPMPFDQSADFRLKYDKGQTGPEEILVTGSVFYTEEKRNPANEGKLYVQSRREYNSPSGTPHLIADIKGKGHYVGTVLISQGLEEGHTRFFEGDDRATIDGKLKLHGTGSEDYFNGGWYAVMDRWDRGISLPLHGSLDYNLMSARTGGYRFYMNDKLNFNESFNMTIEHQPDAKENVKADYTSVAYFYGDRPQFENKPVLIDASIGKIAHRDKLTAQGMMVTLYWLATASYEDPAMIISMKRSDKWFATIDPEAIPMAQIVLNTLHNGRYKLYLTYGRTEGLEPFSIWQRSDQVSEWIAAASDTPAEGKTIDAGIIEITDEVKTITLRKKAGDTSVKIMALEFEKIQ
ncbi:glycoside hydrolase family 172 protein [Chryseolinea sp. T2]|uniref:glycoside hydrolase family 172 protein n=1 Tax=Chryseolinea sp. T2 TaxID=3129255 RepID=UPI0030773695